MDVYALLMIAGQLTTDDLLSQPDFFREQVSWHVKCYGFDEELVDPREYVDHEIVLKRIKTFEDYPKTCETINFLPAEWHSANIRLNQRLIEKYELLEKSFLKDFSVEIEIAKTYANMHRYAEIAKSNAYYITSRRAALADLKRLVGRQFYDARYFPATPLRLYRQETDRLPVRGVDY